MDDREWAEQAHDIAIYIVENITWPWTERQKRLWFIGVLAGDFERAFLENATMAELQKAHDEVTH